MVVLLPFTVNLYHDGLFQVNPLEYVHFNSRVIDDVSFDNSDSDGETNVSLDDVAHVVEQFEHENEGNVNIARINTDHPWLNYTMGALVTYKWIAQHYVRDIIQNLNMSIDLKMTLKEFFLIDVSLGQCKRAKQCALFDHEGDNEVNDKDGKLYFSRDANNQMFLIAWAVVGVENNVNWSWFLSLIRDDLNLGDGGGISIISNGHKEAPSSSMSPHTATPSTSNTMPPPPTPSSLNTMQPPPTPSPSTSNTMPPPSGSNTMPPPPTPFCSNTMPSHATPGSNTSACSNIMPSASTGTNKGNCPLIDKKEADLPKVVLLAAEVVLGWDEASDEEHEFNMDMEAVYEMEREQKAIDEDDQSKKSKAAEVPNQMRIFHENRGRSERIFNQKMKKRKFDEHDIGSTLDKAFDVE
ncbi:hypothetical protein Tco_0506342 [Tanacetum coccineum]